MIESKFSLDSFKQANTDMALHNRAVYKDLGYSPYFGNKVWNRKYKPEEIDHIIERGNLPAKAALSRTFFATNGFYKRILIHYATLLKYVGLLIPNPAFGKSLQTEHIAKRYHQALDFLEIVNIPRMAQKIALRVLIDGSYYGVIQSREKQAFSILDLPHSWCRSNMKDQSGRDIVEFNTAYFNSLSNIQRIAALSIYPDIIVSHYKAWKTGGKGLDGWIILPSDLTVYFELFEPRPVFLQIIPSILEYNDTVVRDAAREAEEIKKILVQKVPHLSDGSLLFEPIEAQEMHKGAVDMLKETNPNLSILTTYADVDAIMSNTMTENLSRNSIEKMKNNIYNETGSTSEIFSTSNSSAAKLSLENDLAMMMPFTYDLDAFITDNINYVWENRNIKFKYSTLPVSWYNERDYISETYKMINTGYSILLPAAAQGISQRDFMNLKVLENDVLKITDQLIPPRSSATGGGEAGEAGAPELPIEDRSEKTIENRTSIEEGGSN